LFIPVIIVVVVWSSALTYCRVVAAKEKAGPGQPWFEEFIWLGWLRPSTARGQKYARYAVILLWMGAPLFFLTFFASAACFETPRGVNVR
jgi:hypothetical protein